MGAMSAMSGMSGMSGMTGRRSGLPAPTNLTASDNGDGMFDASWDAVEGATGYEYQIDSGSWVDVGNVTSVNNEPIPL